MADILLAEDNYEISRLLCDFLAAEGYSVFAASNGMEALDYFNKYRVKLVILDIMLPQLDGFEVCRKIRETENIPILIVSAKSDKSDKLSGFRLGADDYIEKPFDIDLLLAKINGIFKRRYDNYLIQDGKITIDKRKRMVTIDGSDIAMTVKEYDLLLLMMQNKGKTLKKEWIFNQIWGLDSFSEPQTLTVHMKWLRQKIEDTPKNPKRLLTVWGIGYRFE